MIDIMTDGGVFLDLDPTAEFEITFENPLLQDDRIPVPFSTAISFLATPTNKAVFGFLDSMMLEPSVHSVGASILIGGVILYSGTLEYDSLDEDGRLNYTFAGKDLQAAWDQKIWSMDIPDSGIHYPLCVDASMVGEAGIGAAIGDTTRGRNLYNVNGKYRNSPVDSRPTRRLVVPVVEVASILGGRISFSEISGADDIIESLVIFGTYGGYSDAAKCLPDITLADLVKGLCSMFCAALFVDGPGFRIIGAPTILSASPLDWDGKVSDRYQSTIEKGKGYTLSYGEDSATDSSDDDDYSDVTTLAGVVSGADEEYGAVRHRPTGDIYSRKINTVAKIGVIGQSGGRPVYGRIGDIDEILIDRIGAAAKAVSDEDAEEVSAVNIGFLLPKCAPVGWTEKVSGQADEVILRMAALLSLPAKGGDRPTDAYIAHYGNDQVSDKGVVVANADTASSADLTIGTSLDAGSLFDAYHQAYAAWIAKDRQVLTVSLNLSVIELSSFRMWQPVRVRSRNFLVSKLSIVISAGADGVDARADLISL